MSGTVLLAKLRGAAVRLRLRKPVGPGRHHPESMTAELSAEAEDWLAAVDSTLWPRHANGGRLGADYTCRHEEDNQ